MAGTEIGILKRQCLDRPGELAQGVAVWENKRNDKKVRVQWTITLVVAGQKLHKLCPTIKD
jgi:hypothetical protein